MKASKEAAVKQIILIFHFQYFEGNVLLFNCFTCVETDELYYNFAPSRSCHTAKWF